MIPRSSAISRFMKNFPGYKTFGILVFLPIYFVGGGALEYVMIHWTVGETNFYKTYKKTQSQLEAQRRLAVLLAQTENQSAA